MNIILKTDITKILRLVVLWVNIPTQIWIKGPENKGSSSPGRHIPTQLWSDTNLKDLCLTTWGWDSVIDNLYITFYWFDESSRETNSTSVKMDKCPSEVFEFIICCGSPHEYWSHFLRVEILFEGRKALQGVRQNVVAGTWSHEGERRHLTQSE